MITERIEVDPEHIDTAVMERAGGIIKSGGLVAFPTETVYGLGGDALNPEAAGRIYAAKNRPSDNPLIVHIADMEHLAAIVREVPKEARLLADAFWPGPLTMILFKNELVPEATSGGLPTVALRMPVDPVALSLIRSSGGYIAAPSANASGRPSPTTADHVWEDMQGRIPLILDGGSSEIGLESTIVDLTEEVPVILRPGFISRDMLEAVLGEVRIDPGILDAGRNEGVRPKAPGMRYRHYAPRAPLYVVEGEKEAVTARIRALLSEAAREGKRTGVMATDGGDKRYGAYGALIADMGEREDDAVIARRLFAALRAFDDAGIDVIYSEAFNTPRLGMAIMNRLLKAAGHQIIRA